MHLMRLQAAPYKAIFALVPPFLININYFSHSDYWLAQQLQKFRAENSREPTAQELTGVQ